MTREPALPPPRDLRPLLARIDLVIGLALAIGVAWLLSGVLILLFAAVLLAVALDACTRLLRRATGLPRMPAFALSSAGLFALAGLAVYHLVPRLLGQAGELWRQLSARLLQLQDYLLEFDWIADIVQSPDQDLPLSDAAAAAASRLTGAVAGTLSLGSALIVIAALGLFLAADTRTYRRGLVRLMPRRWGPRGIAVMSGVASGLRLWLLGQLFSMAFLGVAVAAGLFAFGIELWLSLALLVAIMTFVPYLGPIVAGVPVVAIAFGAGWETGVAVTVFYLIVQNLEGYVLTPLVQRRTVRIPPALLIGSQVVLGSVVGVAGFLIAAPLAVAAMIAVRMLYIEDTLGKPPPPEPTP